MQKNIVFCWLMLAALALSLQACEDTFAKEVIIDVPKQPNKLVLECANETGERLEAYCTQSVSVLAPNSSMPLPNAFITLYEGGLLRDTLVYNAGARLYRAKNDTRFISGNTYTIKGSHTGLAAVEATTTAPQPVAIQSLSYRPRFRTDANGQERDEIRFSFQDAPGQADYYEVQVQVPLGNTGQYRPVFCLYTVDPDAETGLGGVGVTYDDCIEESFVMKDLRFDGRTKEVTLQVESDDLLTVTLPTGTVLRPRVVLRAVTGDYYRFYKSKRAYEDAEDNPFAEPVSVYTNIKNGFGIFAAYANSYRIVL
jgi:hypothetical protein